VGVIRLHGASGERWTFTATGPVTNLAARLGDRAAGGQILVSAETARRLDRRVRLRSLGPLRLKNLRDPVDAWEVKAGAADAAVLPPVCVRSGNT
jgi:class 3 adenylate cyclase